MKPETIKSELIEWLTHLEDQETLDYLKAIKDNDTSSQENWWKDLPEKVQKGIRQSYQDKAHNRLTDHDTIARQYGLEE